MTKRVDSPAQANNRAFLHRVHRAKCHSFQYAYFPSILIVRRGWSPPYKCLGQADDSYATTAVAVGLSSIRWRPAQSSMRLGRNGGLINGINLFHGNPVARPRCRLCTRRFLAASL